MPDSIQNICGRSVCYITSTTFFILIALNFTACSITTKVPHQLSDVSRSYDMPISDDISVWLEAGRQSRITPVIARTASQISGLTRRERLFKAVDYFWKNFTYDNWYSDKAFTLSADQLFKKKVLGGCSDCALVQVAVFRALQIPARLVLTANVDWMQAYQENDLLISTGHVFIEVYLEDRWYLVDSTYRLLFSDYNPDTKSYPRREYYCIRGRDYWDMGIKDISGLNIVFSEKALAFEGALYRNPSYPSIKF